MTTFYSFPTSANDGVKKVEQIFSSILDKLRSKEIERIMSYKFSENAKLVFLQKSSYEAFLKIVPEKKQDTIFWPIRGKGSAGKSLSQELEQAHW